MFITPHNSVFATTGGQLTSVGKNGAISDPNNAEQTFTQHRLISVITCFRLDIVVVVVATSPVSLVAVREPAELLRDLIGEEFAVLIGTANRDIYA